MLLLIGACLLRAHAFDYFHGKPAAHNLVLRATFVSLIIINVLVCIKISPNIRKNFLLKMLISFTFNPFINKYLIHL